MPGFTRLYTFHGFHVLCVLSVRPVHNPCLPMFLTDLADAHGYDHVYIAPHLDDVVLSCGGIVARQRAAAQRVLVVTVCAGSPPADAPLAPFAVYLHNAWGLGLDPVAARRYEDKMALERLGADGLHHVSHDAIYRGYTSRMAVFGPPQPDDPLLPTVTTLLQTLRQLNPQALVYLPLAVGGHVDHRVVYNAHGAIRNAGLAFYEDFPYAAVPNAVSQRLRELRETFTPSTVVFDPYLGRKIGAIAEYASQLGELFPVITMADAVAEYAQKVSGTARHSERLWLLH